MHLRADGGRVHIGDAGVNVAHGLKGLVHVAGIDGGRETIGHAVGYVDGLFEGLAGNHAGYGAEDFLLGDAHPRIDISEHRGFKKPPMSVIGIVERFASGFQFCALILADPDVLFRGGHLLLVDLGADIHALIEAIPHFQPLRTIHQPVGKLAVNALLHDHAAGCGAALSGSAKPTPQDAIHGKIEIGIVQNDDGVLAAHLQRAGLEAPRRCLAHHPPDFT